MEPGRGADLAVRLSHDLHGTFGDVVEEHQDLVYGVCLRVMRDPAAAEDLAQEALFRAYRTLAGYPGPRIAQMRLRPWLARIALNLSRNELRGRRAGGALEEAPEPATPIGDDPLSLVQRREERSLWAGLLAGLPDRYRLAVALRHVDGLSYAELAEALGRPAGTVRSDVHRGVALLRAAYDAELRRVAALERKEAV